MGSRRSLGGSAIVACVLAAACPGMGGGPAWGQGYRTYDGYGNNVENPTWGAGHHKLLRLFGHYYGDGVSTPAGADRPGPREVSNAVCKQDRPVPSKRALSNMIMQWGQWMDHDLGFRKRQKKSEFFNIIVPTGDPFFDPQGKGNIQILFTRTRWDQATGTGPQNPREQINVLSSYIDCNTVYGFDEQRAGFLRSFEGGRLLTRLYPEGDLMPWNLVEEEMDTPPLGAELKDMFLAGDDRANEQIALAAMHTLWVREHNRIADELAAKNPGWDDEKLYQEARNIVISLNQIITFNEWLPALVGEGRVPPYAGYKADVNPTQSNEFAHAAFRFAHSMLNPTLLRLNEDGSPIPQGPLPLRDAYFRPQLLVTDGGIDPLLRGLTVQATQEIDNLLVEDVRSFLFFEPGPFGADLAALNIQRGRDHGLPTYNQTRAELGMPPILSFGEVSSNPEVGRRLASIYDDVDQIDLWLGGLCEDHVPGGNVGPVFAQIILDTFVRARDGDRFWYANGMLRPGLLAELEATRFSDVIKRNTSIERIQENVFFVWPDFDKNQVLNVEDFIAFQIAFALGLPDADFNKDGKLDELDFLLFRDAFVSYK